MTDAEASSRIKELDALLQNSKRGLDATRLWIILLELRRYSDIPGRVIPPQVFEAMGHEMRMISFDAVLAILSATAGLVLPDKPQN